MTGDAMSSYFAYGTLLGTGAMQEYCPSATPVAVACYTGHALAFHQYSDDPARCGCHIVSSPHDLFGVVYTVPTDEMTRLDTASGVERGWFRRIPIGVTTADGETLETTTYELVAPGPEQWPNAAYTGLVRSGALSAGLPTAYIDQLLDYLDRGGARQSSPELTHE